MGALRGRGQRLARLIGCVASAVKESRVMQALASLCSLALALAWFSDEHDLKTYKCEMLSMSASVGLSRLTLLVGGVRVLVGAVSEHAHQDLNLCGMKGLASLASSPKARAEMRRLKVEEVIIASMLAAELERAKASQQRDLFEAALERAKTEFEISHLSSRLAETQERLSRIEHEASSNFDTSATLAWGSITLASLSAGAPSMHASIVACGGVEAIAVALRKCRTQDKPAVLQAMRRMMDAPESMRAVLGPVLVAMKAQRQSRLLQTHGLDVVLAFAKAGWSHSAIESHLEAVIGAMDEHQQDSRVQEQGLDIVFHLVQVVEERERYAHGGAEPRCGGGRFCDCMLAPLLQIPALA